MTKDMVIEIMEEKFGKLQMYWRKMAAKRRKESLM